MGLDCRWRSTELPALLIAPNRELADQLSGALSETHAFQILADLKKYPTEQTLEIRLRQLRPEVVLLDLSIDLASASGLIRFMASVRPAVHVIALHESNDPEIVLQALRLGASEFLTPPFETAALRESVAGILRLRQAEPQPDSEPGTILSFFSAKPGSGASTLACHSALALKNVTGQRVLLVDLDLNGGTAGFYLRLRHSHSFLDALEHADHLNPSLWASLVADCRGVDVLPAPAVPRDASMEPVRLGQVLEQVSCLYDWMILDLPTIFHRVSLLALAESDRAFLISTSELSSLHLARKAVNVLKQLGIGKDRLQVLVNRTGKGDSMSGSDLEKIFNCPVQHRFPDDYPSLHKGVTLGEPLEGECALGRAIEDFAGRLAGVAKNVAPKSAFLLHGRPAFAGT
jgi:pilus assembly protein CpaE